MLAAMDILVLPGDGIGPEITAATASVLVAADRVFDLGLTLTEAEIGLVALEREGTTLPPAVMTAARAAAGIVLGPVSHNVYPPRAEGGINVSGELRIALDLYANIRPSRSRPSLSAAGIGRAHGAMDLVIVRENTEGFYADRNMAVGIGEFMPTPDMALAIRKITAAACRRIAHSAFALARTRRRRVTAVHKANVLRISDGLFLREVRAVAAEYPDVALDEVLVDAMAALLVRDAARFDVIVTTNMFGDILSDEAAELAGSLGLAGSLNAGEAHAVAQAQHGSAPDIAGQDRANPTSLILSAAMLLDWLGARHGSEALRLAGRRMSEAVDAVLAEPALRTADLGGPAGTRGFGAAVAARLRG